MSTMTVTPLSGPPATAVTVAGDGCTTTLVRVDATYKGPYGVHTTVDVMPDGTGAWSVTIALPGPPLAGAIIPITASCLQGVGVAQPVLFYDPVDFQVTDAEGNVPTMTVAPERGPVGTTITVSGDGCPAADTVRVQLRQPPVIFMGPAFGAASARPDAGGAWTTTMLVTTGFAPGVDPAGAQVVTAECDEPIPGGFLAAFNYPHVPFTIIDSTSLPDAAVAQAQPGVVAFTG